MGGWVGGTYVLGYVELFGKFEIGELLLAVGEDVLLCHLTPGLDGNNSIYLGGWVGGWVGRGERGGSNEVLGVYGWVGGWRRTRRFE